MLSLRVLQQSKRMAIMVELVRPCRKLNQALELRVQPRRGLGLVRFEGCAVIEQGICRGRTQIELSRCEHCGILPLVPLWCTGAAMEHPTNACGNASFVEKCAGVRVPRTRIGGRQAQRCRFSRGRTRERCGVDEDATV